MRSLSETRAFEDTFEVFTLPAVRIIGRETRSGGNLGNQAPALWDQVFSSGDFEKLMALPRVAGDSLCGWTCEHNPADNTHCYFVCALTPAGTQVPEGFVYRDYPATLCARGLIGEDVMRTLDRAKAAGFTANWGTCPWNAELTLQEEEANPPKPNCMPMHWLVPVREAK